MCVCVCVESVPHYISWSRRVKLKDYKAIINGRYFFDLPVKNIERTSQNLMKITERGDGLITSNLLDYPYFTEHHKIIALNFCRQQILSAGLRTIDTIISLKVCNMIIYSCSPS